MKEKVKRSKMIRMLTGMTIAGVVSISAIEAHELGKSPLLESSNEEKESVVRSIFVLNDWEYTESDSEILLTGYIGSETSLYLPGEVNGKQLILPDFSILPPSLTDLTIEEVNGKKVKLQTTTLESAFESYNSLVNLDLKGLDTSNIINMSSMFRRLAKVTSLDVSGWDTSNVTTLSNAFRGMTQLTSLDVSSWDTSKVTNMGYAFAELKNLTSLNLAGLNTSKVTNMAYMFSGASQLTMLDVSSFDTSSVRNMSYMFSGMSQLTSLDVSHFKTSTVTNMSYMFEELTHVTELDVSGFDTSNVTNMRYMFYWMENLKALDVSGFKTSKVKDMAFMFEGLKSLTTLDVSGFDTSSVTSMFSMFEELTNVTFLDVSGFNTSNVTSMSNMFYKASSLTELNVSGWNTSKVTSMSSMFYGASNLTELDVSGWDTSSLTNTANMFRDAKQLTSLDLSHFKTSKITNASYMFGGASNLTSLNLAGWDTSALTNMKSMFQGLEKITSLDLNHFNVSKVTDMRELFSGMSQLETLNVSHWDTSSVVNYSNVFYQTPQLTFLDLSNWDLSGATTANRRVMFKTSSKAPLLVVTSDSSLETYNYVSDNRTGSVLTFKADGGTFTNGLEEMKSSEVFTISSLDEIYLQEMIQSQIDGMEIPIKNGWVFEGWELVSEEPNDTMTIFERLNATYQAKWYSLLADITIPSELGSMVIDPNLSNEVMFANFRIGNQSANPIKISLKEFKQTSYVFTDVLPDYYDSWEGLNTTESKNFALGLVAVAGEGWEQITTPISYVANHMEHEIGIIKSGSEVEFSFDVHHGIAFTEPKPFQYKMVFVFDLLT